MPAQQLDATKTAATNPANGMFPGGDFSNLYGSYGQLSSLVTNGGVGVAGNAPNPGAGLPSWLSSQFSQRTTSSGGDGGQDVTSWGFGDANSIFTGQDGKQLVQVGDPRKMLNEPGRTGDWLKDPSKVTYDPKLGFVTDPNNIGSKSSSDRGMMFAGGLIAGGGLLDAAGLLGAGAEAGGGAGTMTSAAGSEDIGLSMANPFAAGGVSPTGMAAGGLGPEASASQMEAAINGSVAGSSTGGVSSLLSTARTGMSGLSTVMKLLGGSSGGSMAGTGTGDPSALGGIGSLLGLLGLGHSVFGGGVGTASGAEAAGNKAAGAADPWSQYRDQFAKGLTPDYVNSQLSTDPAALAANPAYQFMLQQGTGAINQGDAAQGSLRSGNRGVELEQYGQGLAGQFQNQMFNQGLARVGAEGKLAGVDSSNPAAAGQDIMSGFTGGTNLMNGGLNSLFTGAGAAGGLGSLLSGGLSGLGSLVSGGINGIGGFINSLFGSSTGTGSGGDDGGVGSDILNSLSGGDPSGWAPFG